MLLFHPAMAATEYPHGCLCSLRACSAECSRGAGCTVQHNSLTTPRALMAQQLKTASKKLNWELKGYTTGFSLSIILPVLCRKNVSTLHRDPKRKCLRYSHLAGSAQRSLDILSPTQGSLFSIMHLMSHFPCLPAAKVHRNLQAHTQIP